MPATYTDRIEGLTTSVAVKAPCRAATTAEITLTGLQTIDGIALAAGDRVLVKDQSDEVENGIYVAATTAWTRALDFNGARDAVKGTLVKVNSGTANADTFWTVTTDDPVVFETSDITFARSNSALAGVSPFVEGLLDDPDAATFRASIGALANTMATARILGRDTAGAGPVEELTLSEVLDLIGSATRGDILYRGASAWLRLPKGTTGQVLTQGADDPAWGAGGKIAQIVSTQTGSLITGTTVLPGNDDTIPQNTEGVEILTLAITPTSSTNKLLIDISINLSHSAATGEISVALFQDSTADSLAAATKTEATANYSNRITFSHVMDAGTTSSTTFKVRAGSNQAGTLSVNGTAGTRRLGGVMISSLRITEYTP